VASSLVAVVLKFMAMQSPTLETAQAMAWQDTPLFTLVTKPDPGAEEIMRQFLKDWKPKGPEPGQGVWIQSGLTRLAEHQGTVPLPAASLTKIATTLAALEKWGPNHQFETLVSATGLVKDGVLQGDLVITGSGDPLFIWEEAIALGNSLNQLGIRRVTGSLIVSSNFYMNYEDKPAIAGQFLQQAFNSSTWTSEITWVHTTMPKGTAKPQVAIAAGVKVATIPPPKKFLLLRHQSLSLAHILKEMNIYSNNEMAEILTKDLGGASDRSQLAAKSANIPPAEVQLVNGSGLGVENQLSARAACAMLITIDQYLQPYQLSLTDIFPVAGQDKLGTMIGRRMPVGSTIKTGTLRDVSALAGVLPTRDRGQVCFAIINRGNDVDGFRIQQDQLLQRLSQKWGTVVTKNTSTSQATALLGDPKRNEKISGIQTPL
jgi:D-alanyl-D-alanine carboxypeptidase/D-alanyl-D-alanine-endopeptidase (penicillin-binding protein 4)